jgi:hypothetical protein
VALVREREQEHVPAAPTVDGGHGWCGWWRDGFRCPSSIMAPEQMCIAFPKLNLAETGRAVNYIDFKWPSGGACKALKQLATSSRGCKRQDRSDRRRARTCRQVQPHHQVFRSFHGIGTEACCRHGRPHVPRVHERPCRSDVRSGYKSPNRMPSGLDAVTHSRR